MLRPLGRRQASRPRTRRPRRPLLVAALLLTVAAAGLAGWTAWQARQLPALVTQLQADGKRLQAQLQASDLAGAGVTAARLRAEADRARSLTSGPGWAAAQFLPVYGDDVHALRAVTSSVAQILDAAQPLEAVLPQLAPERIKASGGRVDVAALTQVSGSLPAVSAAIDASYLRLGGIDAAALQPRIADGVNTVRSAVTAARGPFRTASTAFGVLPTMLGASGPQTYVVLLQQDAEARGTGGLVGSFAVVRADRGQLSLLDARGRAALGGRQAIPVTTLPSGLQALWGNDLSEWAGLNLSPHFPWTGELVAAGWSAQGRTPKVDYVVGIDEYVVAALLAATGPVTVDGITVSSENAAGLLSRDLYTKISDPVQIDRFTAALVEQVFSRVAGGRLDLTALIRTMIGPVEQRRLTVWSADSAVESKLQGMTVGGAVPDTPGPFAMAVVNNGGGNKLDAYLKVDTKYDPGDCRQNVRLGHITVTLTNTAPRKGLPDYVSMRNDLIDAHQRNKVVGSNRIILDVYGPVGATSPLADLDGEGTAVTAGHDRNHPVWRVIVPINPGQTRTVDVLVLEPVASGVATASPAAKVLTQPMAIPATASVTARLRPCSAG